MSYELFAVGEHVITLGQVLLVPAVFVVGLLLVRWGGRAISSRLTANNVNADLAHLVARGFYVVGIAVVAITTLDLMNVPLTAFAFVSLSLIHI